MIQAVVPVLVQVQVLHRLRHQLFLLFQPHHLNFAGMKLISILNLKIKATSYIIVKLIDFLTTAVTLSVS